MSKLVCCLLLCSFTLISSDKGFEWDTPMEHDFGDILQHRPARFPFVIKNTSDEPFVIDNVRTTCGCTAPNYSFDPLLPGSYSTIEVVFDAKKIGYFRKKVKVFLSCQRKPEILFIEGYVE